MKANAHSLPAIVGENPQVLILGTIPGELSLCRKEYYAASGNSFWKILAKIYHYNKEFETYDEKLNFLKANNLALWDAFESCVRTGSADKDIVKSSIKLNKIATFLKEHPTIKRVVFNGQRAEEALRKQNFAEVCKVIAYSTSQANTHQTFDEKVKNWKACLKIS